MQGQIRDLWRQYSATSEEGNIINQSSNFLSFRNRDKIRISIQYRR